MSKKHLWLMFFILRSLGGPEACQTRSTFVGAWAIRILSICLGDAFNTPHPDGFQLPWVDANACCAEHCLLQRCADCCCPVGTRNNHMRVIQEANNVSSSRNSSECSFCNAPCWPREHNKGIDASPCSPPSPWSMV